MFRPFAEAARAKINLALHVLGRRADGYHDLDSIVAFADAGDVLRFSPAERFSLAVDGPYAEHLPEAGENIIARAYESALPLVKARGKLLPPVHIALTKNLPVAAGIGGGSANAAAALRGLLQIAGISEFGDEIRAAALALGADVPVCLEGCACRMQGVGERVTKIEGFTPRHALLVNPRIEVPTPEVFKKLGLERGAAHGAAITGMWRNDLTAPAIAVAPVIADVLAALQTLPGVTQAAMSGSGATCFALFDDAPPPGIADALPPHWWRALTTLR